MPNHTAGPVLIFLIQLIAIFRIYWIISIIPLPSFSLSLACALAIICLFFSPHTNSMLTVVSLHFELSQTERVVAWLARLYICGGKGRRTVSKETESSSANESDNSLHSLHYFITSSQHSMHSASWWTPPEKKKATQPKLFAVKPAAAYMKQSISCFSLVVERPLDSLCLTAP